MTKRSRKSEQPPVIKRPEFMVLAEAETDGFWKAVFEQAARGVKAWSAVGISGGSIFLHKRSAEAVPLPSDDPVLATAIARDFFRQRLGTRSPSDSAEEAATARAEIIEQLKAKAPTRLSDVPKRQRERMISFYIERVAGGTARARSMFDHGVATGYVSPKTIRCDAHEIVDVPAFDGWDAETQTFRVVPEHLQRVGARRPTAPGRTHFLEPLAPRLSSCGDPAGTYFAWTKCLPLPGDDSNTSTMG